MEKMCPPLQGLRHLALRVRDIRESKDFYLRIFGLKVVWEPDPQNCYLSSGIDNLALHEVPAEGLSGHASTPTSTLDPACPSGEMIPISAIASKKANAALVFDMDLPPDAQGTQEYATTN